MHAVINNLPVVEDDLLCVTVMDQADVMFGHPARHVELFGRPSWRAGGVFVLYDDVANTAVITGEWAPTKAYSFRDTFREVLLENVTCAE